MRRHVSNKRFKDVVLKDLNVAHKLCTLRNENRSLLMTANYLPRQPVQEANNETIKIGMKEMRENKI